MTNPRFVLCLLVCALVGASGERFMLEPAQQVAAPAGWEQLKSPTSHLSTFLVFALPIQNGDILEKHFWELSDPHHPQYRQHMSKEALDNLVMPSASDRMAVTRWLQDAGVNTNDCENYAGRFIGCDMPVRVASQLLQTEFAHFSHAEWPGQPVLRAVNAYTVPAELARSLSFVGNVHRFPQTRKESVLSKPVDGPPHVGITPGALRERYNITDVGSSDKNSQAVAQFLNQYFHEPDLVEFFLEFGRTFHHKTKLDRYIGPDFGITGTEAALDVEYIMSTGANISTWFWSTGGHRAGQEPFLEWILDVANNTNSPPVHSVSYGDDECGLDITFMDRVNEEFKIVGLLGTKIATNLRLKLGNRGLSIMFASGDSGAGCNETNKFVPSFPAGSPYVTAVGGTLFTHGGHGEDGNYISGGGFSNVFGQAPYQATAVSNFLNTSKRLPDEKAFNRTGRAYPDVSAASSGFWVVANLIPTPGVAGTSCASPTFAGVISLINDKLMQNNNGTLGFLNPMLYANHVGLFDVIEGCNAGCGESQLGFCAQEGWDPVTGLGSPNYPVLLKSLSL